MVHDWVAPGWDCSWGVFAAECPELGGTIGGSPFSEVLAPVSVPEERSRAGTLDPPMATERRVPEKPTLDGLEDRWAAAWEERRHLPLRPHQDPRRDLLDRHAAAHRVGVAPHRARLQLHAHRRHRPLPADARARGLLPDGVGRQRRPHRAPGRELLRRPLRPVAPLRPRLHAARVARARTSSRRRGANFVELCIELTTEDEQAFEATWRRLGLSVDWSMLYQTISDRARATAQRAFLRNLSRDEAYLAEAPTLWDTTFGMAVSQAELEDREAPSAYHRISFHPTAGGDPVMIETTRPELLAACVALVAHPDDERYRPLFGAHGHDARLRRRGARRRPPPGREGQGHGHRHGLHVRRPHRRHLVAGAAARHAGHRRARRPHRRRAAAGAHLRGRAGRLRAGWPAPRCTPPGSGWSSCSASRATCTATPAPITHAVKFYEKGEQAARDRHLPAVVHPQRRPGRRPAGRAGGAGRRAGVDPVLHGRPLPELGRGAERRLADQPPALLRRALPGLVPDRRRRRGRLRQPDPGRRGHPAGRPELRPRARVRRGRSAASPAASPAIPTSWTRGPRRRSRRRSRRGWETDPDLFERTFPMDLRPQAHDIIRTWLFSTVVRRPPRARLGPVEAGRHLRLGPRPRPQEDVEVEGQRRHPHPAARAVRHRRRPLLGLQRARRAPTPRPTSAR